MSVNNFFDQQTTRRLQEFKKFSGLSSERIAREIGISSMSIHRYLKGKTKMSLMAELLVNRYLDRRNFPSMH